MIEFQPKAVATINASSASLPATYETAKTALANCAQIDECQSWADKAAALASYAKQANDDELMKMATRIRDRAIRRAGELLKQIEPATGKNNQYAQVKEGGAPLLQSRKEAAEQAGMSPDQAKQAIRVANVPAMDFEAQVESATPPTVTALAEQGKKPAARPVIDLKGRDPGEFNRSLHFVAEFEDYQRSIEKIDIEAILPGLNDSERARVRKAVSAIDAIHDRIITRI
jgi:hypothetical protein